MKTETILRVHENLNQSVDPWKVQSICEAMKLETNLYIHENYNQSLSPNNL